MNSNKKRRRPIPHSIEEDKQFIYFPENELVEIMDWKDCHNTTVGEVHDRLCEVLYHIDELMKEYKSFEFDKELDSLAPEQREDAYKDKIYFYQQLKILELAIFRSRDTAGRIINHIRKDELKKESK